MGSDFLQRHFGASEEECQEMAQVAGYETVESLVEAAIPKRIRREASFSLPAPLSEHEALERLRHTMGQNRMHRSLLGMGYADCITPPVLLRNILENPGWY
ncbi:MAG: glycine dehydrogenase (aminomethyl-transferring), partial [Verrucomicrobiota bacterium]